MTNPQGPNPQGPNPQGPSHNPADPPAWGQQPSGGWGGYETEKQPAAYDDRTQKVDPQAWAGAPGQQGQGGWNGPQPTQQYPGAGQNPGQQQPYPGQQQPYPAQQPQYPGQQPPYQGQQPPYPGQQQPYPGQQPAAGQQGWGPPQPTQQWGPPQGDGGWGPGYPPLPDAPARSGRSKLPLILGGVGVLVVAVILVLGFVAPGFFLSKVFDTAAVQTGVQKVLTDSYGLKVSAVTCGQSIAVTAGNTFTCDATIDGKPARIPVRITSNDGNYEVGRPA